MAVNRVAGNLVGAVIFLLVVAAACIDVAETKRPAEFFRLQSNGVYRRLFQTIDCNSACQVRCEGASQNDRCLRACGTCCARCKCVPPGRTGNKDACPCYANMKTHGNKPKCP